EPVVTLSANPPSTYSSNLTTPTLSEAAAVTVTVPETVEPLIGELTDVVGGVVSPVPPLEPFKETSSIRNVVGNDESQVAWNVIGTVCRGYADKLIAAGWK